MWLVATIISAAMSIDMALANALAKDRNSNITRQASKIASQIAKDNALLDELQYAYETRDNQLAQNLLNSSPVGSRFQQLRNEKLNLEKSISKVNQLRSQVKIAEIEANNKINEASATAQTSGSAIIDLIKGGITSTPVEYKSPIQHKTTPKGGNK